MSVATMIEKAEQEGVYYAHKHNSEKLVVLDGLTENPLSGIRLTVWYDGKGFTSECYDGSGREVIAFANERVNAVQNALNGYLDIVNYGI